MTTAILAPIPAYILDDAEANGYSRVAFGSLAYEFFRRLELEFPDERMPVLLYASHQGELSLDVSWVGTYQGWKSAEEAGRYPTFVETFRPPLSRLDWTGSVDGGAWALYWIVGGLRRLDRPVPLRTLTLPSGRRLSPAFVPRGPILVNVSAKLENRA